MKRSQKRNLVLDADVIIHFFEGECALLLGKILQEFNILVPDIVFHELKKNPSTRDMYERLLTTDFIQEISLDNDGEARKIYLQLLKAKKGNGESACMALCLAHGMVLASSNLTDTLAWCQQNNISYLTTMDILQLAYESKIMDKADCDYFIYNVKSKGSKLIPGIDKIEDYQARKKAGLL